MQVEALRRKLGSILWSEPCKTIDCVNLMELAMLLDERFDLLGLFTASCAGQSSIIEQNAGLCLVALAHSSLLRIVSSRL